MTNGLFIQTKGHILNDRAGWEMSLKRRHEFMRLRKRIIFNGPGTSELIPSSTRRGGAVGDGVVG